ncbi:MAG: hypothetical protein ACK4IK_05790 [Bacteroidia bacterium]
MVFVYTSCRKYEEDPYTVIFQEPQKRIVGEWICESIVIDGIDSTNYLKDTVGLWTIGYYPQFGFSRMLWMNTFKYEYTFIDKHRKLIFRKERPNNDSLWLLNKTRWLEEFSEWEIIQLNKQKFKIFSNDINSKSYEITFNKK